MVDAADVSQIGDGARAVRCDVRLLDRRQTRIGTATCREKLRQPPDARVAGSGDQQPLSRRLLAEALRLGTRTRRVPARSAAIAPATRSGISAPGAQLRAPRASRAACA